GAENARGKSRLWLRATCLPLMIVPVATMTKTARSATPWIESKTPKAEATSPWGQNSDPSERLVPVCCAQAAKVYFESTETTTTSTACASSDMRARQRSRSASSSPQMGENANGTKASTSADPRVASARVITDPC